MNEIISTTGQNAVVKFYKPSELLGMFASYLAQQEANRKLIYLRGIYLKNPKHDPRWSSRYDTLRDEDTQTEITLQIPHRLCEDLKDGNLVTVGGVLGRRTQNNCHIQLMLVVSRVEVVQEQAIDEAEIKRMELRQKKASLGFKNVDSILEQLLFNDERPQIALVLAQSSITMSDFQAGINAAKSAIDFEEHRVNFANSAELVNVLNTIDGQKYHALAIVRGGGAGIEKLDDLSVLETIIDLHTPVIGAIGHVEEKLFFKQLVDKCAPTPNGLGQYFSEIVETVSEKKSKSRAVLTEKIKKQFKEQLEAGQKQNKALQDKLQALTKTQEEATKKHNEQLQALTKAQEEASKKHSEQVQALTKAQEEATKKHNEQLVAEQKQNKKLQERLQALTKAQEEASKKHSEQVQALTKAQEVATKKHNEQVEAAQKQNKELQGQLKSIQKGHQDELKKLNDNQEKLQNQLKTQQEDFGKNLTKMQETNAELQKSLSKITAQNTESLTLLNQAKERAKELERQLEEARNNAGGGMMWKVIAVIAVVIAIILFLVK